MSSHSTSRGAWNCRALVAIAAVVVSLTTSGNLFGEPARYVTVDSSAFAATLLDSSAGEWVREMDAELASVEPAPEPEPSFAAVEPVAVAAPQDPQPGDPTYGGGTVCPPVATACPIVPTQCELTNCPAITTLCPFSYTKCPAIATTCPQVPTQCEYTKCPPVATQCPITFTKCPAIPTKCPTVATTCHYTVCPAIATKCPVVPTQCEYTRCPAIATVCPTVPTTCQETVCPKTTLCGSEKTICYVGTSNEQCPVEPGETIAQGASASQAQRVAYVERVSAASPLALSFVPRSY